MLATITNTRRQAAIPVCYVDNSPLNYVDPTGLTQAGNPLTNLNISTPAAGGKVAANKPVSTYVASAKAVLTTPGRNVTSTTCFANLNLATCSCTSTQERRRATS
jgi:hypothetical protein